MPNPERLHTLRAKAIELAGKGETEYRLDTDTSVGIAVRKTLLTCAVNVHLRSNEPVVGHNGYRFYPYKGLSVAYAPLRKPVVTEVLLTKVRDKDGLLVDDWRPDTHARPEKQKEVDVFEPDIDSYVEAIMAINPKNKHDVYGRTAEEQAMENELVADFVLETARLLDSAPPRESWQGSLRSSSHLPTAMYQTEKGTLIVKNGGKRRRAAISFIPHDTREKRIFMVRATDHRLCETRITNGHVATHPVTPQAGEQIITLLKSIT